LGKSENNSFPFFKILTIQRCVKKYEKHFAFFMQIIVIQIYNYAIWIKINKEIGVGK